MNCIFGSGTQFNLYIDSQVLGSSTPVLVAPAYSIHQMSLPKLLSKPHISYPFQGPKMKWDQIASCF